MSLNPKTIQKIKAGRSRPRSASDAQTIAWLDDYFGQFYQVRPVGPYERAMGERGTKEPVLVRYLIDRAADWQASLDLSDLAGSTAAYLAIYRPHADAGILVRAQVVAGRSAASWAALALAAEAHFTIDGE